MPRGPSRTGCWSCGWTCGPSPEADRDPFLRALVAGGGLLRDLRPLLRPGPLGRSRLRPRRRQAGRRPRGDPVPPRPPPVAGDRRGLADAVLPLAPGRLRLRRGRLLRREPAVRVAGRLRPPPRGPAPPGHEDDRGLGPQPQQRPPPLVR